MIPFLLATIGGYLIGDSFGDSTDEKFDDGGTVSSPKFKVGDNVVDPVSISINIPGRVLEVYPNMDAVIQSKEHQDWVDVYLSLVNKPDTTPEPFYDEDLKKPLYYVDFGQGDNDYYLCLEKDLQPTDLEFEGPTPDSEYTSWDPWEYANGGEVKVGDIVKSKTIKGTVYESYGTMFKLKDEYGNKSNKFHSVKDFKKSDIIRMSNGGGVEENMDVQFIEYKEKTIMFEPHSKKYYSNDIEFDSLEKAKKYIDSGSKKSSWEESAYRKGVMAKGGEVKVGDILTANTGVKVKVIEYDPKFGGRVRVKRIDEYSTDKPSQFMPLNKFKL